MEVFSKVNMVRGAIMAALAAALGQYWFLFAGLLFCNVCDWLSGWMVPERRAKVVAESARRAL